MHVSSDTRVRLRCLCAVLVTIDGSGEVLSELPVATAVPLEVHKLKAGQKLPKGAMVVKATEAAEGTRHGGRRGASSGSARTGHGDKVQREANVKTKTKQQQLMFERTTGSATWPSEKNPLKDFDADFLDTYDVKGFPATTGTADWPFTKQPLLGFDEGFRNHWKGWEGPEYNVYAELPQEFPFLETKLPESMAHYKTWQNSGAVPENNIYDNPEMWPNY